MKIYISIETYINGEIIIKLNIKKKNNKGDKRKCSSISKNSVINIKNPIILLKEIINNCMLSNKCFFFSFSFLLRMIQQNIDLHKSINQFKF